MNAPFRLFTHIILQEAISLKVVVFKSPKFLKGILKYIFKI